MKRRQVQKVLIALGTLFISGSVSAQLIDGHAYMVGDYVEVGVNANGHEGAPCTDDVHCVAFSLLGMVANPAMDDWTSINGDFFAMGAPESGFGITYTLDGEEFERSNNAMGLNQIPGSIVDFTETADSITVIWVGSVDDLELTITYELQKDQHYYTTSMSIDNIGDETFTDVYYYRNLDPDNNQAINGNYSTENTIIKQAGMADDSVIVQAKQSIPYDSHILFVAEGENWRGFYGGFSNRNGNNLWNGVGVVTTEESAATMDVACGIAYKIESLPPGRAASEVFSFATAFKPGINFDSEEGEFDGINENVLVDFKIYPNPTNGDNITIDISGNFNYSITDIKGSTVNIGQGNGLSTIDLSAFDKGVYFITLNQDSNVATEKIIVQ